MEKTAVRKAIRAQRLNKKVTIAEVAKTVGKNPTFVAAALNGNHRLSPEEAGKVGKLLDLDKEQISSLSAFPVRADFPNATDPFKYRLLEVIGVYGDSMREMANEMFGDGIMSAIDFTMHVDKEENPKGDRVILTLNGKFLPYKAW